MNILKFDILRKQVKGKLKPDNRNIGNMKMVSVYLLLNCKNTKIQRYTFVENNNLLISTSFVVLQIKVFLI